MAANGTRKTSVARTDAAEASTEAGEADIARYQEAPQSAAIADRGVRTGEDFANLMSALMSDVITGRVTPDIANATCNAGGKLLKIVEMQYKYGSSQERREPAFILAPGERR